MLKADNLNVFYDQIQAIKDVSFEIQEGELVALLGANGAGKTTIIRTISGLQKLRSGKITYNGQDISTTEAHKLVRLGISQSPEGRQIFGRLTVLENLQIGAFIKDKKADIGAEIKYIYDLFPALKEREKLAAGALSGGEQQMLAIGRALMSSPKLLLLDEPSLGLAPLLVEKIFEVIQTLKRNNITILLVEQNVYKALEIADRAYVLESGAIKLHGTAGDLLNNSEVKKAYLGG
ncbi:branched-chain amino acid transport system ATP-binding protein [Desulfotomaculum arcticum]|uniref:Branched-chain amino acid transport system ATP-binding protein n=1 Tax=Desulfotruncus arcticus DSM 17038 TaxID=1121424 RepID=A0A1I2V5V1_9FIRM|nr:ABC transporter ATP-binding protein [Desulfotruncus arcticus]SFG84754.1 branched-chain amino acid transport system ATP-binding protein [Desulfotomaculum arcticum] [Desulfotruncus arcticus DSM 17038]